MYKLFCMHGAGSMCVEAILGEIGAECEKVAVTLGEPDTYPAEFIAANPKCEVPTLVLPDGAIMTESAAILLFLADAHPEAELLPATGTTARAQAFRWMLFCATNLYELLLRQEYSDRYTTDANGAAAVKEQARISFDKHWDMLDAALEPGPWLLGEQFSVTDIYIAMLSTWHSDGAALLARCARLKRLVDAAGERDSLKPMFAAAA